MVSTPWCHGWVNKVWRSPAYCEDTQIAQIQRFRKTDPPARSVVIGKAAFQFSALLRKGCCQIWRKHNRMLPYFSTKVQNYVLTNEYTCTFTYNFQSPSRHGCYGAATYQYGGRDVTPSCFRDNCVQLYRGPTLSGRYHYDFIICICISKSCRKRL